MKAYYAEAEDGTVSKISEWKYEALVRLEGWYHRIHTETQCVIFPRRKGKRVKLLG